MSVIKAAHATTRRITGLRMTGSARTKKTSHGRAMRKTAAGVLRTVRKHNPHELKTLTHEHHKHGIPKETGKHFRYG